MKKIDIHTHILPDTIPNWFEKYGYGDFISLHKHEPCCGKMMKGAAFFREVKSNSWDAKERIAEMNETNVSVQVLSTVPVLFNYWAKPQHALDTSRFYNDHIAATVDAHPDRFVGLGTVPMQDTKLAIQELERCVKDLKMPGIEIGTNVNQMNLSDPSLHEFWAAAADLDACIFVHPWDMMGEADIKKYWLPWLVSMPAETSRAIASLIFGGVFEQFPKLRFAFAHGGGSFPATVGRIQHGFDARPDLCAIDNDKDPRSYLGHFWIDSLLHYEAALRLLMGVIGADKICVGSDYPFPLGELNPPGGLIERNIKDEQVKAKILWQNALDWLGNCDLNLK